MAILPFPAFIEGRCLDVLAANPLATALSTRLVPGANRLRDVFLDPGEQAMWPGWEMAAAALVSSFRSAVGTDIDDPRCVELVGELSLARPLFRQLWARHDVRPREGAVLVPFLHSQVGLLRLNRQKLHISGTDGLMRVVFHPDPATADADNPGAAGLRGAARVVSTRFVYRPARDAGLGAVSGTPVHQLHDPPTGPWPRRLCRPDGGCRC